MTQPAMPSHPPNYFPALDGLRGIAITLVIIWHYIPSSHSYFPGWAGVDLFFVLSGYLITGRLLDTKGQKNYFSRFYRNRALRILPLYYALVIPFLLLIPYLKPQHLPTVAIYKEHWLSLILFTQNWTFIRFGIPHDISLVHLWTLAVEEQFYLVWPLVIFILSTPRIRINIFISLILLVLVTRCLYYMEHPDLNGALFIHFNTIFRMDSLVAGSLLCQLHRSSVRINTGWAKGIMMAVLLLCLTAGIMTGSVSPTIPFFTSVGYTLLALLFACMLHLALQPGQFVARICQNSALRFIGKISYGLYIIHMPVRMEIGNILLNDWSRAWPNHRQLLDWIVSLSCLLLSLLLSVLSFRYFESFFLRLKTKGAPKIENR